MNRQFKLGSVYFNSKPRVVKKKATVVFSILLTAVIVLALIFSSLKGKGEEGVDENAGHQAVRNPTHSPVSPEAQPEPTEPPIIDLSHIRTSLKSTMLRINSPEPWGRELIYSAGNASTIDEPVLVELYVYDMDTEQESKVAETQIQFGEIYEARISDDYIVWLDTNQKGSNVIYALDRKTEQVQKVKESEHTSPQLRLYGAYLVWVEQVNDDEDRLYLYHLESGEPIVLDTYHISSYGTCPPSIFEDMIVWTYPKPHNPDLSIIKKLVLKDFIQEQTVEIESEPVDEDQESIIDPQGFAIYPSTNGKAIAWLDNLNPSLATLKLTLDDGIQIMDVAKGVGRIFSIGDTFVAYMQDDAVMLYFWNIDRYARLTKEGEAGRLSGVAGNVITWYDANNPSQAQDLVQISIVDSSIIEEAP